MASRKAMAGLVVAAATALLLAACSGTGSTGQSSSGKASGDITFLTNRTDLQTDGTWDKYVAEFKKSYPDVNVKIEGITNYEDDVKTRLSTPNGYGDVLLIPNGVTPDQYASFFESLGKTSEFSSDYRFLNPKSVGGEQYGIALGGNANGVLYNTEVFKKAGITSLPKTESEFLSDLKTIKEKTGAIGLYTNYKDGWPLGGQWTNLIGAVTQKADAQNEMTTNKSPWKSGTDIYAIDSLLYDAVHQGLTESDPLTTNWEQSKGELASGKIATMVLGSWAISQFQAAAKTAGVPETNIGFMPFPASVDGKQATTIAGDYFLAVNKNSSHKAAARAWLDWLVQKSGFTDSQGMISAVKSAQLPANLDSLTKNDVKLIELAAAPKGKESLFNDIADKSQVDVWGNLYRQKLIDIARGQASGDKSSYFSQLNQQWGDAVSSLSK